MESQKTQEKDSRELDRLRLHFLYMFAIFVMFSAFLMSDRWSDKKEFTEYLTNVATFVSLVLGLVAIFYSFFSNSSLSESLGGIVNVSNNITNARTEIEKIIERTVAIERSSKENVDSLKEISTSVENRINLLNDALAEVAIKTEDLHLAVKTIPDKIDKLETKLAENKVSKTLVGEIGPAVAIEKTRFTKEAVSDFILISSVSGRILLYAILLAHKAKKTLSLNLLYGRTKISSVEYVYGYMIATNAIGLIDTEEVPVDGDKRNYEITYVDSTLLDEGADLIVKAIDVQFKDSDVKLAKYRAVLRGVDEMFSEGNTKDKEPD